MPPLPAGLKPAIPSSPKATDQRLRLRGHWDRQLPYITVLNFGDSEDLPQVVACDEE